MNRDGSRRPGSVTLTINELIGVSGAPAVFGYCSAKEKRPIVSLLVGPVNASGWSQNITRP